MAKSMRIRTDDTVEVVSCKDKGKLGKVLRVDPTRRKVFVEGANIVKRHQRPTQSSDPAKAAGGVVESEGPIHISNVSLVDPKDNKPTRVGISREGGLRVRVTKRTDSKID